MPLFPTLPKRRDLALRASSDRSGTQFDRDGISLPAEDHLDRDGISLPAKDHSRKKNIFRPVLAVLADTPKQLSYAIEC